MPIRSGHFSMLSVVQHAKVQRQLASAFKDARPHVYSRANTVPPTHVDEFVQTRGKEAAADLSPRLDGIGAELKRRGISPEVAVD